jgi:hypothetical protein
MGLELAWKTGQMDASSSGIRDIGISSYGEYVHENWAHEE